MIVKKMAGQEQYKGSFAYGIRSLSLPTWRESFTVSGNISRAKKAQQTFIQDAFLSSIFKLLIAFQWASQKKV